MGNDLSFSGYGATPENACKSLEEDVKKIFPDAFVTISGDDLKVVQLSPRSVARVALVSVGDGKEGREVKFQKDQYGITCSVSVKI